MSDSNGSMQEKGNSANPEETQEKNNTEKLQMDGGNSGNEKKEQNAEKKSRISEEVKSTLLFSAASVAAGYISFLLTPAKAVPPAPFPLTSLLLALASMAAIFAASAAIVKKLAGKKDVRWIMGNGGAIYLFLWFVTWIIFYNAL